MCVSAASELYQRYSDAREGLGGEPRVASFDNPLIAKARSLVASEFEVTAGQHLNDLANFVNEFVYNYRKLLTWRDLLPALCERDRLLALIEFVHPSVYFGLSAPAAIEGRFHHSTALLSHLANEGVVDGWTYQADLGRSCYRTAREHALHWAGWTALRDRLGVLNNRQFKDTVDDFRNEFHHGAPRSVEMGGKSGVARVSNGVHLFYVEDPLPLSTVIEALAVQVTAAVDSYDAFASLVQEQCWRGMANKRIEQTPQATIRPEASERRSCATRSTDHQRRR
jgi:hypothetical protein